MIAIGIAIARINIMKLSSVLCKVTEARNCEALERCVFEVDSRPCPQGQRISNERRGNGSQYKIG